MMDTRRGSRQRCLLVWVGATAALAALLTWTLPDLGAARTALAGPGIDSHPFATLLVWVCSAAGLGCGTWLWTLTTVVVLEAAFEGGQPGTQWVPTGVRRLVLAACGVAIIGVALPAGSTPGSPHLDHTGRTEQAIIAGLPVPDRATGGPGRPHDPATAPAPAPTQAPTRAVVVQPGDTLWAIAEADVGASASDAAIAAHWQRIYALNRDEVGSDPDLIRPDQHLQLPTSANEEES